MKVLIGCECSQIECLAFLRHGHDAYSCDILPCYGGRPDRHYQCDVREIWHDNYDLIILHPPCTYLSNAGANRLRINGVIDESRYQLGLEARKFFFECLDAPAPMVAVENPSPNSIFCLPPCSQYIEPYMFGDPFKKRTLLWLRGLPILMATDIVIPEFRWINSTNHCKGVRSVPMPGVPGRKYRSQGFPGIAEAMASQWGDKCYS